jgi:PEP-CTERM motif-containing protein
VRLTAPEPSSMLLFGSGFLLVGAVLRRRLRAPKAK